MSASSWATPSSSSGGSSGPASTGSAPRCAGRRPAWGHRPPPAPHGPWRSAGSRARHGRPRDRPRRRVARSGRPPGTGPGRGQPAPPRWPPRRRRWRSRSAGRRPSPPGRPRPRRPRARRRPGPRLVEHRTDLVRPEQPGRELPEDVEQGPLVDHGGDFRVGGVGPVAGHAGDRDVEDRQAWVSSRSPWRCRTLPARHLTTSARYTHRAPAVLPAPSASGRLPCRLSVDGWHGKGTHRDREPAQRARDHPGRRLRTAADMAGLPAAVPPHRSGRGPHRLREARGQGPRRASGSSSVAARSSPRSSRRPRSSRSTRCSSTCSSRACWPVTSARRSTSTAPPRSRSRSPLGARAGLPDRAHGRVQLPRDVRRGGPRRADQGRRRPPAHHRGRACRWPSCTATRPSSPRTSRPRRPPS